MNAKRAVSIKRLKPISEIAIGCEEGFYATLNSMKAQLAAMREDYQMGILSLEDAALRLGEVHSLCSEAIDALGLVPACGSRRAYSSMLAAHESYVTGEACRADHWEPWLHRSTALREPTANVTCGHAGEREADASETALFFELWEASLRPVEELEPWANGLDAPRVSTRVYGTGTKVTIGFDCADDGGLLSCPDPIGSTFTLVSSDGMVAELHVTGPGFQKHKHNVEVAGGTWEYDAYDAHGYVEGYTARDCKRTLRVVIHRPTNSVHSIWFYADSTGIVVAEDGTRIDLDYEAHRHYPRWSEYFERRALHYGPLKAKQREMLEAFLEGADNALLSGIE